ncbi:sensor histidine kinase [Mucilaginibacter paludis]|uniref:Signal transduction histidine kinase n=1 Tax=Mucilaginibacter paludis DSM 18603 TaxID=714943 RepID=H1YI14_9SPHI|nr:sensor histidine kinase [Mucilaginibacter paludis]EHQ25562.1 putative signal transduction histidine kinase [Mucilaginibacter paludis DSM 18603]
MKKNFQLWFNRYKLQLLVWALYIFYEAVLIGYVSGVFGHPMTYLLHYIAAIILFYVHAEIVLPWALAIKKFIAFRLPLVLVELAVFVFVSFNFDVILVDSGIVIHEKPFRMSWVYFFSMLYRGGYFAGFSTGYYYLVTYMKEKRKTNELEKQHLNDIITQQKAEQELTKAQNAFLKAQINPHFLFNTLDFIYHSIADSSPIAADAVIVLTEMMRYAVDADKMGEYIYLGDEIDQAENLIYLNQVRQNHSLYFKLNYTEQIRNIRLIPLVLLTLIENIFKHGDLSEPNDEAVINLNLDAHYLHIDTYNLISQNTSDTGSHAGLNNIQKRLGYTYGSEVTFNYHADQTNHFHLNLSIPLGRLNVSAVLT